jgi:3-methyladenine DNA glycosylase AlkD
MRDGGESRDDRNGSIILHPSSLIPSMIAAVRRELRKYANAKKAKILSRFFKTGKGEYGEEDKFLGIVVPDIRKTVKKFRDLPLPEAMKLVRSPWHEERLCGLLILVDQFEGGSGAERKRIFDAYLASAGRVNNWDLVDLTAPKIMGAYLEDRHRGILKRLAASKNLWKRRIAIVSTHYFIRRNDFKDTLEIARLLRNDPHDLIHKSTGWMLREVGKRDVKTLEKFLGKHGKRMPRTTLRYAIERFPEKKKRVYMFVGQ